MNKLIITKQDNQIISAIYEGNDMVQVNIDHRESISILGNIYIGKVKNIVKNINAAFVEISGGKMCYLSLEENLHPIYIKPKQTDKLVVGDELLVQISKEDIKTKAPVVTTNINFTGKYVVLIHGRSMIGISSKIEDEEERKRLKKIMKGFKEDTYGFIVRTNAVHMNEERIHEEIMFLKKQYEELKQYGVHKSLFSLLHQTPPGYICDIRDGYADRIDEIVTDDLEIHKNIKEYLENYQKEDLEKLQLYKDDMISLKNLYSINSKLEKGLNEKVWLKSGATLIIQPTEALTVIDVNTGKAISGKKNVEDTFFKVNMEAAQEIAKQIRLRNLSGIIIIDFIDMSKQEYKVKLMKVLEELFRKDPVKTTLVDMTALNLVEVTRKKVRKPLYEQIL
ncbi:Rne/Rng family ribonuclease [Anaerocolumna aminovalerica]|uniref:Ribonuclease G n=1 Tax=Anaerocolumna aminovalerica TaxID=1527 RepID=A0A1I5BQ57_9FIRM|nr:ribonuclease E/G [Anaerocolumna aminovalerica]MBU5330669.1 ribonuclease E/G [Anaerocolumna aminovalerica]SFN76808.1 ribonuclease G [Anaerocolumna aminovalerica]